MPSNSSTVMKDPGSYIEPVTADIDVTGTAAGAGDNVESNGEWHAVPDDAQGLVAIIQWEAVLADTETMSLALNLQDATDVSGAGAADFFTTRTLAPTVVVTNSGGGTERGVRKVRYPDIRAHRGFIRTQTTGDLSAGATDTFKYNVIAVYGGMSIIPPSPNTGTVGVT